MQFFLSTTTFLFILVKLLLLALKVLVVILTTPYIREIYLENFCLILIKKYSYVHSMYCVLTCKLTTCETRIYYDTKVAE